MKTNLQQFEFESISHPSCTFFSSYRFFIQIVFSILGEMFRKTKTRSNLRQRVLSDDDDDDDGGDEGNGVSSGISVASTVKGTSISGTVKQQQQQNAEKVNKAEGNQELQAGVVTEEHHLLSFDNFEGL